MDETRSRGLEYKSYKGNMKDIVREMEIVYVFIIVLIILIYICKCTHSYLYLSNSLNYTLKMGILVYGNSSDFTEIKYVNKIK